MKKVVSISLCIILIFLLSACSDSLISLDSKFDLVNSEDYVIDEESSLGFRYIYNEEDNIYGYLLGFLDNIDAEITDNSGYLRTVIVGKECISITGIVLDLHVKVNNTVILDVLNRFHIGVNDSNVDVLEYYKDSDCPYIISKNDDSYCIDYVTSCSNNSNVVAYYRIIIRDVYSVNPDLTEEQYESLHTYLGLLMNCMGIDYNFDFGVS